MFQFYAVPAWALVDPNARPAEGDANEQLSPALPSAELIPEALARVEYRGFKALERVRALLAEGNPAVFARSPNDLPALLRTADQLITFAKMDAGERARVWRCQCGTRYAVPVALVRPVSLRCERCGNTVELDPTTSEGEASIADPRTSEVNTARQALSEFFREAMARGWPVLVKSA